MKRGFLSLGLLLLATPPAPAQVREPVVQDWAFVSERGFASAIWVNPGASAFNQPIHLVGHLTWDRPEGEGWTLGQYLLGLQHGVLAFGYRHDEFNTGVGFAQGDAYTLAAGLPYGRNGFGVSRTWRTVGETEGSWAIGWLYRAERGSTGLVWRDIGSPEVRGTKRPERLIGAISIRPGSQFQFSAQADYQTDGSDFRAFRLGAAFTIMQGGQGFLSSLRAFALSEWEGDGDFGRFFLGLTSRRGSLTTVALGELDSSADVRSGSVGGDLQAARR